MGDAMQSHNQGRTILVVDDIAVNLDVAVCVLEGAGFQALVARDGEEALQRARQVQPDLILLDVVMPGIDGFETCRRLKAAAETREVPVIFMTALNDASNKVTGFAAGGVDYITKPFQFDELLARVETHLSLRSAQKELVAKSAQLQESEARYRGLFEAATDGLLQFDFRSGRITEINASLLNMLGCDRNDLLGHKFWEVEPFRNFPACKSAIAELPPNGRVCFEHLRLRPADAARLDVEIVANVYLVGGAKMVQCNVRNITARKRAEEALLREQESLKSLLENIRAVPWEIDLESGACTYIGPQVEQQWRWSPARFAEPGFLLDCVHPEDRRAFGTALKKRGGHADQSIDCRILRLDQTVIHVRSLLSPATKLDDGRRIVRGVSIDVTAQKELEIELRQAQKLESVGRLASGVAHEINTPVQFVNDSCHFVRDGLQELRGLIVKYRETVRALAEGGLAPQAALEQLSAAEAAADTDYLLESMPGAMNRALDGLERVSNIVRSMKEFAHPNQKQKAYADINKAILSTLTIARNEYKYVADLKTELGDIPEVCCFLGDFNQVILNIVVNAAHAIADALQKSNEEKGLITVRTELDGSHVLITISDTGGGIPEHIRDKIFDPFFTTKEVGKGTGQGLAIARSVIVDKHQGELRFDSEVGRGTTFIIRLPIESAETVVQESAA